MGSAQSYLPAATAVVAAAAYGYAQLNKPATTSQDSLATSSAVGSLSKKQKRKKSGAGAGGASAKEEDAPAEPSIVSFPPVVPGGFDVPTRSDLSEQAVTAAAAKPSKKKKKKTKKAGSPVPNDAQSESSATAPESSAARKPRKPVPAKQPGLDDAGWTRVDTKKKAVQRADVPAGGSTDGLPLENSTSDAGITTSVTGNSSPVTERTEDESHVTDSVTEGHRRPLAERLLPKPRKTGVEDLLEEPDYPQLARVMRIQPRPDEQPAAGFSWGDYEDVDEARGTAHDADGEDDGGWGVVKGRGRNPIKPPSQQISTTSTPSETITKKQRQHAARRDAQKSAKADAEAERLATLAKHKRALEEVRMAEQRAKSSKKATSGGMSAYVDENGKLVWS